MRRRGLKKALEATKPDISIIDACLDANLFADWFEQIDDWQAWFAFLRALFALPMRQKHLEIFKQCTKRAKPPTKQFRESWLVVGRRGGKSRILALIAVYLACFVDWRPFLTPGEHGTIILVAVDRKQARVIFRYIEAFLDGVPMLAKLVKRRTMSEFNLEGNINIEIHTASFRTVRGYTIVAALLDEIAFFRSDESTNPDFEIIDALRPAMITIPGSMLLCASSPYSRRGALWRMYDEYFGEDDENILVWQASTKYMHPSVEEWIIRDAYKRDPNKAKAEYGAEFRSDVEMLVSMEVVEACTLHGRYEVPRQPNQHYVAFVDPSGGSADSMTLSIAHNENGKGVVDLIRERKPPFNPEDVVDEFAGVLKQYGITSVIGDRYGGEWPRERFQRKDIYYEVADLVKSDIYRELLPLLNSGQVELLDNERCNQQLVELERRKGSKGRDIIDHPPRSHDDVINAVAGALVSVTAGAEIEIW